MGTQGSRQRCRREGQSWVSITRVQEPERRLGLAGHERSNAGVHKIEATHTGGSQGSRKLVDGHGKKKKKHPECDVFLRGSGENALISQFILSISLFFFSDTKGFRNNRFSLTSFGTVFFFASFLSPRIAAETLPLKTSSTSLLSFFFFTEIMKAGKKTEEYHHFNFHLFLFMDGNEQEHLTPSTLNLLSLFLFFPLTHTVYQSVYLPSIFLSIHIIRLPKALSEDCDTLCKIRSVEHFWVDEVGGREGRVA